MNVSDVVRQGQFDQYLIEDSGVRRVASPEVTADQIYFPFRIV